MAAMQTTMTETSSPNRGDAARDSAALNSSRDGRDASRPTRRLRPYRAATDDEILGLDSTSDSRSAGVSPANAPTADDRNRQRGAGATSARTVDDATDAASAAPTSADDMPEPENLRAAFDANPELRQAWQDAHSYRESFATPEEARAATALLADLDRMDALFFSRRPEDHAELARAVAALDPAAFASLAQAMSQFATEAQSRVADRATGRHSERSDRADSVRSGTGTSGGAVEAHLPDGQEPLFGAAPQESSAKRDPSTASRAFTGANDNQTARDSAQNDSARSALNTAQIQFLHSANAAAVRNVVDAIETQVERLLPEGVSRSARSRVVGEIYRELDSTLRANRQLSQQMRDAFKSGPLDADHERALVSLITSRARQALPGVAKRVMNEWSSTIVAANNDRRARQRAAETRVDIAGSGRGGNDGIRPLAPRDIDYARLSDSDILNM